MTMDRRNFLRNAGTLGTFAAAGAAAGCAPPASTPAAPIRTLGTGMARGLTVLTFRVDGADRLGVKTEKGILDVAQAATILNLYAPATVDDLLQQEDGPSLQAVVAAALAGTAAEAAFRSEASLEYGPLVSRPEKIVCVGLNYRKHAEEIGSPVPEYPVLFNKFNGSLNRHKGTVKLPVDLATNFDYEVELVIVIGKTASRVSEADALSYVAGYATGNDFTARDLQNGRGGQWMVGKAIDEFAPIGPYLVTADQVDPDNLAIECRVNGETRQSSNTSDLIFGTRKMISYISDYFTLKPGDIIFTGTPQGVIQGMKKEQQVWLKPGDAIACSLEKLGELTFDLV
ncbi:MAG: fumarylacetoacetate hydrolase family protein [Acidobacteriota bacterium]|nr:fumarylacetoacetate hydrolase family protein [Acidobacteriota bacterium]